MTIKDVTYPKGGKVALKANECWIRKGTYQLTATRGDIDKMYALKKEESSFSGEILIHFEGSNDDKIEIKCLTNLEFPSQKHKEELELIIQQKEELKEKDSRSYEISNLQLFMAWQGTSYEQRSIETLKRNLEKVEDTYADEDYFYLFETMGLN